MLDEQYWPHSRAAAGRAAAAGGGAATAAATARGGHVLLGVDPVCLDSDHLLGEELARGSQLAEAAAVLAAPPGGCAVSAGVQALLGELERELVAWEGAWGVAEVTVAESEAEAEMDEEAEEELAAAEGEELAGLPQDLARRRGNSTAAASSDCDVGPWSLEALVNALQLSADKSQARGSDVTNSSGNITNSSGTSSGNGVSGVSVNISATVQQAAFMGRAGAAARGSDSAFDLHQRLVVELQPRALLLPPPSPSAAVAPATAAAAAESGDATALAEEQGDQSKPLARLRVVVSGHASAPITVTAVADSADDADADGDAANAPMEVLLRCCGQYLRARVAAAAPAAAEDGVEGAATVYEIALLQRPLCPPGGVAIMLVRVRRDACVCVRAAQAAAAGNRWER